MRIVTGNLLDLAEAGEFDVIVHGCNCLHIMGAGIAKQIAQRYPEAVAADRNTPYADRAKLGSLSIAEITRGNAFFDVVNAYTQFGIGGGFNGEPAISYLAVEEVFAEIATGYRGARIGYPRIGAGLGGGDWAQISRIIDERLNNTSHTLVEYCP